MGDDPALDAQPTPETLRERTLGRASFAFLLDQATSGIAGLPTVDALLVMAVNQANIAPLTREPLSRLRYGKLDAAAPDTRRRPVSINAVAASLRLPFETVRRRAVRLAAEDVCHRIGRDYAFPQAAFQRPAWRSILRNNVVNVQQLFGGLAERGLVEAWSRLPPPVRADDTTAARSSPLAR